MVLLNLKDQRDIVKVIEYLVEINQTSTTVEDVMQRFGLSMDEYRMCCNLGMPALTQENMKGRYDAVRTVNRSMRKDIVALYEAVKDEDNVAARGVKLLWEKYCHRESVATFGGMKGEAGETECGDDQVGVGPGV